VSYFAVCTVLVGRVVHVPLARIVRYEADGWGVGELVFEGERLAWHALPGQVRGTVPGTGPQGTRLRDSPSAQRLAARLTAFFSGEAVEFGDVALVDDGWTDFRRACVDALMRRRRNGNETVTVGTQRAAEFNKRGVRDDHSVTVSVQAKGCQERRREKLLGVVG